MFQNRKINKIIWWIWSPAGASVIFFIFILFLILGALFSFLQSDSIGATHLLVFITAVYTLITFFTLYSAISNSKTQLLVSLYDLLKITSKGKKLLLDPKYNWAKIKDLKNGEKDLLKLIILLDRAATLAFQIGAVNELLIRYWDWYYNVFDKYRDFLDYKSETKTKLLLDSVRSQVEFDTLNKEQIQRTWLFHLFEMEHEVNKYIDRYYPFLNLKKKENSILGMRKIEIKIRFGDDINQGQL